MNHIDREPSPIPKQDDKHVMKVSDFCCQYFHGLSGLEELRPRWDYIFNACHNDSYYNDWRWHFALQKHLIPTEVCYVYVSHGDDAVAILPLQCVNRRYGPLSARVLLLPYHVAVDLSDMLVSSRYVDVPFFGHVLDHLRSCPPTRWELMQLTQFTERSALVRQVDMVGAGRVVMGYSAYAASETPDLSEGLSKKQIKNVRRNLRNAELELGGSELKMSSSEDDLVNDYEVFLKVEASGWKGDDGTRSAILFRPDAREFYAEVLQLFGATGQAVLNILRLGTEPAAAQMGIRTEGRLSLLKIGFDEKFREHGPGAIALLKCLDAEQMKVRELSLVTCPPWSDRWHFTQEEKYAFEAMNCTLYAWVVSIALRFRGSVKAAVAWWRRLESRFASLTRH